MTNTITISRTAPTWGGLWEEVSTCRYDADGPNLSYKPADGVPLPVLTWAKWCLCHGFAAGTITHGRYEWRYLCAGPLQPAKQRPTVQQTPAPLPPPPVPVPVPVPPVEPEPTGPRDWNVTAKNKGGTPFTVCLTALCKEDAEEAIRMTGAAVLKVEAC